jgi:hypothetical protein
MYYFHTYLEVMSALTLRDAHGPAARCFSFPREAGRLEVKSPVGAESSKRSLHRLGRDEIRRELPSVVGPQRRAS